MSGARRRAPYPGDIKIDGQVYRMFGGRDRPGGEPKLALEHPEPLAAAAPPGFDYSAQNPMLESTHVYDNLVNGFGQKIQAGRDDHGYRFAANVDCSVQGQVILGPQITVVTPSGNLDTTNGIRDFFEIGGSLYALNGRYVLKRTADNAAGWSTTSKDFGANKAAVDHVVFADNNTGTTLAYVAMGDSEFMYKFDGTTWTQHASLYARALCVVGSELYRAHDTNYAAKVDRNSDPWTAGNWGSDQQFRIGDKTSGISRMLVTASGIVVFFKTDGIYALNEDGEDVPLFADLKVIPDAAAGAPFPFRYNEHLHCTYNGQHFRINDGLAIQQIGPELSGENDSLVRGFVTAGCGAKHAAYCGLYNPDTGHSHLIKLGAMARGEDGRMHYIDAWHGSLANVNVGTASGQSSNTFGSRKITAMRMSTIGAPAGHHRLYIGCSDGTIGWFTLPCTPNPLGCSSYTYSAGASDSKVGTVFFPFWHGGFPKDEKVIRAITVTGTKLSVDTPVEYIRIRTAGNTGNYAGYVSGDGLSWFADSFPGVRNVIRRTVTLADIGMSLGVPSTGAGTSTDTPVVTGMAIHYSVNPPIQLVADVAILCEDGLVKRNGVPFRIGADQIRTLLREAAEETRGVDVVLPDEEALVMEVRNWREELRWDDDIRQWRSVIVVRLVQTDVDNFATVSAHALS